VISCTYTLAQQIKLGCNIEKIKVKNSNVKSNVQNKIFKGIFTEKLVKNVQKSMIRNQ
jgi:hypothetical protein